MLSNRIRRLAPPPRPVPLTMVCSAMLGITGSFGAIFLIVGLIFTIIFTRGYRPIDNLRLASSAKTARGIITGVSETNAIENDVVVYAYRFTFTARDERDYSGVSYSTGKRWSVEVPVIVEYVPEDPSVARIQGARISVFSPWVLFVLIFPAVGAGTFLTAAVGGLRQTALLRYGEIADARILSSRQTGMSINDVPVLEYSYEIRTGTGEVIEGKSKSLPDLRIGDESPEPALFLPSRPGVSILVDAISLKYPLDVDDATGEWIAKGGKRTAALYLLTWAAAIGLTAYFFLQAFGG
ncbi:MAG: DUF3592 domain-containing protein [Anaerolineales bacterium]|nr:DUF3592 domain-containing protein [Anaerolineales bacterium]